MRIPQSPTYRIALDALSRQRWTIALVVVFTIIATSLEVLFPLVFRFLIDQAIPTRNINTVLATLAVMLLLPVIAAGFSFLEGRQRSKVGMTVTRTLRRRVVQQVLSMRILDVERYPSGELLQRMLRTCGEVGDVFVGDNFLPLITRLILFIGNVLAMFIASWRLALITMIALPLLFSMAQLFKKYAEKVDTQLYTTLEAGSNLAHEIVAGLRTIRAVNGREHALARWRQWDQQWWLAMLKSAMFHGFWIETLSLFLTNLILAIVLGFGVFEIIGDRLSIGGLVAFLIYAPRSLTAMQLINRTNLSVTTVRVAAVKLDELFAVSTEPDGGAALPATPDRSAGLRVTFDSVTFRYGRGDSGISDLSFDISAGEFVGIVGPSGGGKSTLFDLLIGFYTPDSGHILFDQVDMQELSLAAIREAMGVVFQDTFLWNTSLLENLVYPADVTPQSADVAWVVRAAHLEHFVADLPDGLQTLAGERGHTFSGGERQRIAIARAMLRHPRLLLLDEATSALDPLTEEKLRNSLESLRQGRTTIVIAHRLATVAKADRIIVIDKGHIVEQGTPRELLDRHGLFYEFYQTQKLD